MSSKKLISAIMAILIVVVLSFLHSDLIKPSDIYQTQLYTLITMIIILAWLAGAFTGLGIKCWVDSISNGKVVEILAIISEKEAVIKLLNGSKVYVRSISEIPKTKYAIVKGNKLIACEGMVGIDEKKEIIVK